jgi:uncharacterized membrane protein
MVKGSPRAWLVGFSVLGLAASAASAYIHFSLLRDASYTSFCDISASINCESVYRSAYGSIGGVPVAVLGVLWFALALLLTFVSDPQGRQPAASTSYLFVASTAALAVILYLAYASFFIVGAVCILCVLTYVAVIGVFIVSGAASSTKLSEVPVMIGRDVRRLARNPVALTIAVLYLAGAASAIAFLPRDEAAASEVDAQSGAAPAASAGSLPAAQRTAFEQWLSAQPRVALTIPNDGARVLIVKFNDYQCPPCRQTFMEYKPILGRYQTSHPGQVKFVSKDFPLEAECNTGGVHVAACEAAAAVRLARGKNRADEMEEWLFQNQASMSPDLVRQGLAKIAGISDFDAQYPGQLEQVRADVALGRQLGVNRTPTFFINGVKIEGGLRPEYFDAAIAHELNRGPGGAENK